MLKLILGPSGSGKTQRLLSQISLDIQAGRPCFLLVPEQQAYISERDIPAILPQNAGLFFKIVHFSGLAEDLFHAYGGVNDTWVEPALRTLFMWDTLRELSPMLRQYGSSAKNDPTLTSLMLATLGELRSAGISSEMLESAAEQCDAESPLQNKLMDLALIEAVFRNKIQASFGNDPEEKLIRASSLLEQHSYFAGARVYIDSFTSFTFEEYAVIKQILLQAELVTVSLCTDELLSQLPHFATPADTARRLRKMANDTGIPCDVLRLFSKSKEKNPALALIESHLWNFKAPLSASHNVISDDAVQLYRCRNLYEESEAAALHILDLTHKGYHFGDIALVVRDTESYRGVLDAALERHGIPYFLSERTDLSSKPLFRLILSALRCVTRGYRTQDVMTLVKTGLAGVTVQDASMFEEYCETWHINGKGFLQEAWSMNPDGLTVERSERGDRILEAANRTRRQIIAPLEQLYVNLRAEVCLPGKCRALYRYLNGIELPTILSKQAELELARGDRRQAGETLRLYQSFTDMLVKAATVLPDSQMNNEEFVSALSILFTSTDMGSVPNVHDCVVIGSAATLRVEKIRAAMLLGLCEGEFPRNITDEGILSDSEKVALEEYGIVFASKDKIRFSEELLYVYRAMTKPRDRLYLSTVTNEPDGSAKTPSLAFNRVRALLGAKVRIFDLSAIREQSHLKDNEEDKKLSLPPQENGTTLRLSQSKIRSFLLCPYSYYATYCLQLREKKESTPSYADDGTFLHFIFEHFMREILQKDGSVLLPDTEEVQDISDRIILEYLEQVCPCDIGELEGRLLHLYTRLRKLSQTMLVDMVCELRNSAFKPAYFEQVIGMAGENGLPPVRILLENGSVVTLSGKIDRIDLYPCDGTVYVRVVDYKSGEHKFELRDVSSGLDIQLILYLWAFLASDPDRYTPAGAAFLYAKNDGGRMLIQRSGIRLSDDKVQGALDATSGSDYTKRLIPQTAEEIQALAEQMLAAVESTARRILSGEANKTPSPDACRFCPVAEHCDMAVR